MTTARRFPSMLFRALPWPILHEATLQLALASIPISATLIHPALGMLAALGTAAFLHHLHSPWRSHHRSYPSNSSYSPDQPDQSDLLRCPLSIVNYQLRTPRP